MRAALPLITLLTLSSAAHADTRRVGLTSFESLVVVGDIAVDVVPDYRIGAVVDASRDAIERLEMNVQERTLTIRIGNDGPYGASTAPVGPVHIRLSAQNLRQITLLGSGILRAARLEGDDVRIRMNGAGEVAATIPAGTNVSVVSAGAGTVQLTGRADGLTANVSGPGSIDASALTARDMTLRASGTGSSRFTASRSANLTVTGAANASVAGRARCTISNMGAGSVTCENTTRGALPRN